MLLIITPFKNEEEYIEDYLNSLLNGYKENKNFRVVLIDDNSNDNSYSIANEFCKKNEFVVVSKANSTGKTKAINQGLEYLNEMFTHCKFCDADDILTEEFFKSFDKLLIANPTVHNLEIVDKNLNYITQLRLNPMIFESPERSISNGIILPKASWIIPSRYSESLKIPEGILFEDFWFSYSIKNLNLRVTKIPGTFYLYRQNSNQTFGGVNNYSEEKERWRIERLLNCYNSLVELEPDKEIITRNIRLYYKIMLNFNLRELIKLTSENIGLSLKLIINKLFGKYIFRLKIWVWNFR